MEMEDDHIYRAKVYTSLNYRTLIAGLPPSVLMVAWGLPLVCAMLLEEIAFLFLGVLLHPLLFFLISRDKYILEILPLFLSRKHEYAGTVEKQNMKSMKGARLLMDEIHMIGFFDSQQFPGVVEYDNGTKVSKTYKLQPRDCTRLSKDDMVALIEHVNQSLLLLNKQWQVKLEALQIAQEEPWLMIDPQSAEDFYLQNEHNSTAFWYKGELYLTIIYDTKDRKSGVFRKLFGSTNVSDTEQEMFEEVRHFVSDADDFVTSLSLTYATIEPLEDKSLLEYMHKSLYLAEKPYNTATEIINVKEQFDSGTIETGNVISINGGEKNLGVMGIHSLPPATDTGFLEWMNLDFNTKVSLTFSPFGHEGSKAKLEKNRTKWGNRRIKSKKAFRDNLGDGGGEDSTDVNIGAVKMMQETEKAISDLSSQSVEFGELQLVLVFDGGTTAAEYKEREDKVYSTLQRYGYSPLQERKSLNANAAYWSTILGNEQLNVRKFTVSTRNIASLFPVSAPYQGEAKNKHLGKISGNNTPHVRCLTTYDNLPYYLNLNVDGGDVGNALIAGKIGAGKSVLLSTLALAWQKYPKSKVIFFDKDNTSLPATALVGGSYIEPMSIESSINFALFDRYIKLKDTHAMIGSEETRKAFEEEVLFLTDFFIDIGEINNISVDPDARIKLKESLTELDYPERQYYLKYLVEYISAIPELHDMRTVLQQYAHGKVYGTLFDSPNDFTFGERWTTIEMGPLMTKGSTVLIPALLYLFHRIEQIADQHNPMLIILDEAWLFLKNEHCREKIEEWLRTLRKRNVFLILATQSTVDIDSSEITNLLRESCPTKIFLPNTSAKNPTVAESYKSFGLTYDDLEILVSAQGKRDYYVTSAEVGGLVNLNLTKEMIRLISSHKRKKFYIELMEEKLPFTERYEKIKTHILEE